MSIELFSLKFLIALLGFLVFGIFAWKKIELAPAGVLFLAPIYLLKTQIGWLPLNFLEILIWGTALLWLIKKISEKDFRFLAIKKEACFWPVILIMFGVIFSTLVSADLKTSAGILKSWFLAPAIFGLIVFDLAKKREIFKKYLWAIIFSGVVVAVISFIYLLSGQLTFDGRLKAFYLSPNHLAMYLAPALILALGFWFEIKKKWQKIFFVACFMLYAVCLYFTFSYAAWLAIFGALIFAVLMAWRAGRINIKKLFIASCLLLAVFLIVFSSQLGGEKMESLFNSDRSSFQSRLMIWQSALKILSEHPILGIGPGLFQNYYLEYQKYFPPYLEWASPQPHNLFLAFWLQAGILGLIGFGWLIFSLIRNNFQLWRKTKQPLVLALAAVFIYFLIHGLADTPFWKNDLALIFFSLTALSCKAGRLFD